MSPYVEQRSLPEAQFPLAVPPFDAHSLAVKQDPIITLVVVDDPKVHCLWIHLIVIHCIITINLNKNII